MQGYRNSVRVQRTENSTQSTQKFLRRDVGEGVALQARPSALAPSAPAALRLLMRCCRAARSMSRASARSHQCCGLRTAAAATGSAAFGGAGAFVEIAYLKIRTVE
jgi:hypothetical protein